MKLASFEAIVNALNAVGVPFILVGGLAVVAHGFGRTTHDANVMIRLGREEIEQAFAALETLGYRPRVPITAEQFADAAQREAWVREKGMLVLNFHSDTHRDTPLDVFVTEPFDFPQEYAVAWLHEVGGGATVRVWRLDALLAMKRAADRPQDLADVDELHLLHGRPSSYDT